MSLLEKIAELSNELGSEGSGDEQSESDFAENATPMTQEEKEKIAQKENRAVFCLRLVVLILLLASAVCVPVAVYRYVEDQETSEFETQFHSDANKIMQSFGKSLDDTLGATDALATKWVSHARTQLQYTNVSWPFVTIPDFYIHAAKWAKLSRSFYLATGVTVVPELRGASEAYAKKNNGWVEHDIEMLEKDPDWKQPIVRKYMKPTKIVGLFGRMEEPRTPDGYSVSWQRYPPQPTIPYGSILNVDTRDVVNLLEASEHAKTKKKFTMVNRFANIHFNESANAMEIFNIEVSRNFTRNSLPPGTPIEGAQVWKHLCVAFICVCRVDLSLTFVLVPFYSISIIPCSTNLKRFASILPKTYVWLELFSLLSCTMISFETYYQRTQTEFSSCWTTPTVSVVRRLQCRLMDQRQDMW